MRSTKLLNSKSEARASSGPHSKLPLPLALLLLLLQGGSPLSAAAEPRALGPAIETQLPNTGPILDWRIEVVYESMAHAFALLTDTDVKEAKEIVRLVEREAGQYDIDSFRILAFIVAESRGNPQAKSRVGARGLMQIMPATGRVIAEARDETWAGVDSLYDVETNVSYGVWYYHHLLQLFEGDEIATIGAYNWGPQHIIWRMKNDRRLPKVYPSKVLKAQERLEREFSNEIATRYWRSFIEHNPDPRTRREPSKPEVGGTAASLPDLDGEGLCLRCGERIRSVPRSLLRRD